MSQEAMKLALEAFKKLGDFPHAFDECNNAIEALEEALAQEQGEPLPDFYITEKMADSIYKLKSPTWSLCISGNKAPTMHRTIPVFVGYVKTKPVEQEQGEPVAHCEAGPEYCWKCNEEMKPTYGSEEIRKLREVIASQAKIIEDYIPDAKKMVKTGEI